MNIFLSIGLNINCVLGAQENPLHMFCLRISKLFLYIFYFKISFEVDYHQRKNMIFDSDQTTYLHSLIRDFDGRFMDCKGSNVSSGGILRH